MNAGNRISIGFDHNHGYQHHFMQNLCGFGCVKDGRSLGGLDFARPPGLVSHQRRHSLGFYVVIVPIPP